jgi:putative flavoprotein involved in K+ transport
MLRAASVRLRPRLTALDGTTARFADGSKLHISTVVWATGYHPDHSWIDVDGVLSDGRPIHHRGVTPAPGVDVVGLPAQHSRGSALLGFVRHDAAHLADRIAAHTPQSGTASRTSVSREPEDLSRRPNGAGPTAQHSQRRTGAERWEDSDDVVPPLV